MIRNLILPHILHGLLLEDLSARLGALPGVEKCSQNLDILGGLRVGTGATAMEEMLLLGIAFGYDWFAVDVVSLLCSCLTWPFLVHIRQFFLHLWRWDHVDILQSERLHDVVLDPVVEFNACNSFENDSSPVDTSAISLENRSVTMNECLQILGVDILPYSAWFVNKRHAKNISLIGMENVKPNRTAKVSKFWVETENQSAWHSIDTVPANLQLITKATHMR